MATLDRDQAVSGNESDAETALRAFFEIAERWELSTEEQIKLLGSPPRSTFFKWKKEGAHLSFDTKERLSHVLNIYKCLRILFTDETISHRWLRKTNRAPFLNGVSAVEFMTANGYVADLFKVRSYLDAQRGG
jgi:hypothetical protein